jgi:hypothetical protein
MPRPDFISFKAYVLAACFAVIVPPGFANAQPKKPPALQTSCLTYVPRLSEKFRWEMDEQTQYEDWENGL